MSEPRRFFFDDGTSRKRWQISSKARTHTVSYGRITGALRETTRRFETPTQTQASAAKLIAAKLRDGYQEIDPARLEIVRSAGVRAATEKQVAKFEARVGVCLPDDYRRFLRTTNGGRPNPNYIALPGVEGFDNVGVGVLFSLRPAKPGPDELTHERVAAGQQVPDHHLPIASEVDLFTLSLHPRTFGAVFWWHSDTENVDDRGAFLPDHGDLIAGSFDEFLTRLSGFFDSESESKPAPTRKASANPSQPKASVRRLLSLYKHEHTPAKIDEIARVVAQLGDLSGIEDGRWPFNNLDSPRLLRILLDAGLDPEILDAEGHTLLYQCALSVPCIELLLQRGVDVNRRCGGFRETALMRAVFLDYQGHNGVDAARRLIEAGTNPTAQAAGGLQGRLNSGLEHNPELAAVVERGRRRWRKAADAKKARPKK